MEKPNEVSELRKTLQRPAAVKVSAVVMMKVVVSFAFFWRVVDITWNIHGIGFDYRYVLKKKSSSYGDRASSSSLHMRSAAKNA